MRRFCLVAVVLAGFTMTGAAAAADGMVCYSTPLITNQVAGFGTTNYPQLDNTTKFACRTPTQYTFRQLMAKGYKVESLMPVVQSVTIASTGASSTTTRYMLVVSF